ncbi:hypothetical protein [Herbiconiux liukaitaii]|uniref:hypothetical protein n=1 Tax=Herbiconiux liukaitaii TaxID=3342799 RepID=UPI0035B8D528
MRPIDSWDGYWGISTKDVGQVLGALPNSVLQIILRVNSPAAKHSRASRSSRFVVTDEIDLAGIISVLALPTDALAKYPQLI